MEQHNQHDHAMPFETPPPKAKSNKANIVLVIGIGILALGIIGIYSKQPSQPTTNHSTEEYNRIGREISDKDALKIEKLRERRVIEAELNEKDGEINQIKAEIDQLKQQQKAVEVEYLKLVPSAHASGLDMMMLAPPVPPLIPGKPKIADYLLSHAHKSLHGTEDIWVEFGFTHNIKPEVPVCIAWADTRLGKAMATSFNYGNVGNNDRGNRVGMSGKRAGIEAIFKALNNKYLGHKQTVGSLSYGGGGTSPIYASSPFNWNNNVLSCLREMFNDETINEGYEIRI